MKAIYEIRKTNGFYSLIRLKDESILFSNLNFMNIVEEAKSRGILDYTGYKY